MITGKDLKKARKALKMTQKALADALGVSVPSVINWESGKSQPRGANKQKLEDMFPTPVKAARPAPAPKPAAEPAPAPAPEKKADSLMDELAQVAQDLYFDSLEDMFKTIVRLHKLDSLDL